jgi:large subunit ribosomal protein L6
MSRIGKLKISIPAKVTVKADKSVVSVEGPKGKISKRFDAPVAVKVDAGQVSVTPTLETRFASAMHGTTRAIIANMINGVVNGYEKNLEIQGVGFKAEQKGKNLVLNLGYSHTITYPIPADIKITIVEGTKLKVEGVDKQLVGSVAADLKHFYKPEPYKGKGVHIVGEFVRRKEGKTAGK